MKNSSVENVIIIGGGIAGLSAAVYTARAELNPLVISGFPSLSQLTYTSEIENFPGIEKISGSELVERIKKQATKFGARIIDKVVTEVNFKKNPLEIYVSDTKAPYQTKATIIATGAKAMWLGLESEQRLRGQGVSSCATCDGFFFRGKIVAVVGGGDAAFEEALFLTKFASKVYLIHRRDTFRASKIMQNRVFKNEKIEVIKNAVIEEVLGQERVEGIRLKVENEEVKTLHLSGLFVAIGHKPDTDIFLGQLELDERGHILVSMNMALEKVRRQVSLIDRQTTEIDREKIKELTFNLRKFDFNYRFATSVKGVFACGDCVDHDYRQASTASGMGVAAALEVEKWLETH